MKNILTLALFAAASLSLSAQSYHFDLGSETAADGYVAVTPETLYSAERGYGFEPGAEITSVSVKKGDALVGDFVTSSEPFKFSVKLPEGNYLVKVTLGDTNKKGTSKTTIKSEIRRLMVESLATENGQVKVAEFNCNVRTPQLSKGNTIKLNTSELDYATGAIKKLTWDDKLTLQFYDEKPAVCAIDIEPASENVVQVFIIGDSTVTDQASAGTWGQYLPRWFDTNVVVCNHAESGMTLKGFRFGRRWDKIMESAKAGDYLLIQLGTNDEKAHGHDPMWDSEDHAGDWDRTHSAADKDYIWELATMAVQAQRKGMIPVIVSPMTKINRMDATATELMTPYGVNAPKAAELAGCAYIDLWGNSRDIVKALGQDALHAYSDGTHTDNYGAYLFSLCIVKGLKENGLDIVKYLVPDTMDFDPKNPAPLYGDFTCPIEPRKMPQGGPQGGPQGPQGPRPNGMTEFGPL